MTDRYSDSSIATFRACPLKYKLTRIDRLELRDQGASLHHLAFGRAMHAALEGIYSSEYQRRPPERTERISIGRDDILMGAQEIFRSLYPLHLDPTDPAKSPATGARALELYVRRWAAEDRQWKVLEVEALDTGEFESGLGAVRLDLVVENVEHGGIYGVDHKFTSSMGGNLPGTWWERFNPNSQVTHYIDHIAEKYGRCDGFYINAIGLGWRDEKKSNGASNVALFEVNDPDRPWLQYSEHERRFIKGNRHREMMAAWGSTVRFERQMFNRSEEQIAQERASTRYWIEQIERATVEQEVIEYPFTPYGFNTDACHFCQFKPACSAGWSYPRDRELFMPLYREVCGGIIKLPCPTCSGNGVDPEFVQRRITEFQSSEWWQGRGGLSITWAIPPCPRCITSAGWIDGPRCRLDRAHGGACSEQEPAADDAMVIEVEE